jgi:hypothetical protein
MTAAQQRYRRALVAAAGEGASASWDTSGLSEGAVRFTAVRGGRSIARAIVDPEGRLWGAWDPQHLTDDIDVRTP